MDKSPDAFRTISEVAEALETPAHVLRFWETRFPQIRPVKRAGGRRYYRPGDVSLLLAIRHLLYTEGMSIRDVQKMLREQGAGAVIDQIAPAAETLAEAAAIPPAGPETETEAETAGALQPREEDSPSEAAIFFIKRPEASAQALPGALPGTLSEPEHASEPAPEPAPESAPAPEAAPLPLFGSDAMRSHSMAAPLATPRQTLFPGFSAEGPMRLRQKAPADPAGPEFRFDLSDPPPERESRAAAAPADSDAARDSGEDMRDTTASDPGEELAGPTQAARLRALPVTAFLGKAEQLAVLSSQITRLRQRLSQARLRER